MSFTNSYRLERIYFEKLKDMINKLQPYLNEETDEKLKAILENSIDDNGAILLLYRNLGEAWAELSDLIKKADEKIDQTKEEAEKYHDELNERIDEVNNYIMGLIRILEETKQDKLTAGKGIEITAENVINNISGILNRSGETQLLTESEIVGHLVRLTALGNNIFSKSNNIKLENYDGVLLVCTLVDTERPNGNINQAFSYRLANFDSDCKYRVGVYMYITDASKLTGEITNTYAFDSVSKVYMVKNGVPVYEHNLKFPTDNTGLAVVFSRSFNQFRKNYRFGKKSTCYLNVLTIVEVLETTKTTEEINAFLNNEESGWGLAVNSPLNTIRAYGYIED